MQALIIRILDDLRGSWRFRWIGLAAAWAFCLVGWAYVFLMPNVFEASARVYVDSQTALGPLLRGLALDPNVESELSVVRQALLSRPNLEAVARETDLDLRAKTPEALQSLLVSLRERITVTTDMRSSNSPTDGLYRISFQDSNRGQTLAVVETLLNTFVEETLGSKRTGQASAQRFLDDEIAEHERRLTEAETRLADFKKRNVATMPGVDGDYFRRLQTEMTGAGELRKQLSLAEARRAELERQLAGEEPVLFGFDASATQATNGTGDITFRIQQLEKQQEELLLRFTEKHPEVIAVRSTLEELRKRQDEELRRVKERRGATGSMSSSLKSNPVYQGIQSELNRTEVQVAELKRELALRSAHVSELQKLVDTVPEVEAELARLNRDYEITRTRYLELVERRETAKLSESAEKQGVVKFQIIDPPAVGLQPVAPDRVLLIIGVFVLGVGGAGALMYLLNQLRPVYQNVRVLAEATGLPVLGSVSRTWLQDQKANALRSLIKFSGAASALAATCFIFIVWNESGVRLVQRIFGQA